MANSGERRSKRTLRSNYMSKCRLTDRNKQKKSPQNGVNTSEVEDRYRGDKEGEVPLGELCHRPGIAQNQYYTCRDRLSHEGAEVFSQGGKSAEVDRLKQENEEAKSHTRACFKYAKDR